MDYYYIILLGQLSLHMRTDLTPPLRLTEAMKLKKGLAESHEIERDLVRTDETDINLLHVHVGELSARTL